MQNKKVLFILLIILLLSTLFRLSYLGKHSLWFDEAFSINLSSQDLKTIITSEKNHPPLYYILLHYWIKLLGQTEAAARLLSAIFAILSIFALYKLSNELFERKIGMLAISLLAFSPFHIHYSQETRMYTLIVLLTILSCYFFTKFLKENKKIILIAYFLFSTAAIYTHYFALFIIAAQNIFILIKRNHYKNQLIPWFILQLLLFLSYLPWIWPLFQAIEGGKSKYLSHLFLRIPYTFMVFNLGYSGIIIDTYTKKHLLQTILTHWFLLFLITIVIIPIFLFGLKTLWQKEKNWYPFIFLYFFLPFILALLVSFKIPMLAERYLIVTLPAYYLILSIGVLSLKNLKIQAALLLVVLLLSAFSLRNYYFNPNFGRGDWRSSAQYVASYARSDDTISFYPKRISIPFNYYYKEDLEEYSVSNLDEIRIKDESKMNPGRLWLIISHAPKFNYEEAIARNFRIVKKNIFPMSNGIYVFLLENKY